MLKVDWLGPRAIGIAKALVVVRCYQSVRLNKIYQTWQLHDKVLSNHKNMTPKSACQSKNKRIKVNALVVDFAWEFLKVSS